MKNPGTPALCLRARQRARQKAGETRGNIRGSASRCAAGRLGGARRNVAYAARARASREIRRERRATKCPLPTLSLLTAGEPCAHARTHSCTPTLVAAGPSPRLHPPACAAAARCPHQPRTLRRLLLSFLVSRSRLGLASTIPLRQPFSLSLSSLISKLTHTSHSLSLSLSLPLE